MHKGHAEVTLEVPPSIWRHRIWRVTLVLVGIIPLLGLTVSAQNFTPGSIRGSYSAVFLGKGGPIPTAAIGRITFDGAGKVTAGRTIWNVIDARYDERKNSEYPVTGGSYQIDENGRGTLLTEGLPILSWQLLVGDVETQPNGTVLAQTLDLVGDSMDPFGGNLITVSLNRYPDGATFALDQINGKYVREFTGHGGFSQLAAFGAVNIDGSGGITSAGNSIVNLPGPGLGERVVTGLPAAGNLVLDSEGFGILSVQEGQEGIDQGNVLVRKATRDSEGNIVALEAFLLFPELFDLGNLSTGRVILQFEP